jgi:ubiquinone/menaquinone biosynthesis C-methylase UbiE
MQGSSAGAYLPGYQPDVARMLSTRTAAERAGLLLPRLAPGMRVLDLGCGPGTITAGLAAAVAPGGSVLGVDLSFEQLALARTAAGVAVGLADALPVRTGALDAVFAHALFDHLTAPHLVLAEARRVLRPGGLLALSSSDWSAADIHPRTAAVDMALHAYWTLRQRTGTDPFVGRRLAGLCRAAGCTVLAERTSMRVDLGYTELAAYLRGRLTLAADDHPDLAAGAQAAAEWAQGGPGHFTQCWIEVLAT